MRERFASGFTRRHLQLGLALLWLLDGALQFQPFMFGKGFARQIIAPTGAGQPALVHDPVHWAAHLTLTHPVVFNAVYAVVQTAIGLGLLTRRTTKVALAGSIAWGIGVWWLGEGLGGLTTGPTILDGAPGAALLYVVLAVIAWPRTSEDFDSSPSSLAVPAWALLWVGAVALQLSAGNDTAAAVKGDFGGAGQTGWIGRVDQHIASSHFGVAVPAALVALELLIAMLAFVPGVARRVSGGLGATVALVAWVLIQGFGEISSGSATDPNAGPLIALMALALVFASPARLPSLAASGRVEAAV